MDAVEVVDFLLQGEECITGGGFGGVVARDLDIDYRAGGDTGR